VPDACLRVGDAVVQVTRYTSPCLNITGAFAHGDFSRVSQTRHPGWSRVYARVLVCGSVRPGDAVRLCSPEEAERLRAVSDRNA
jgi:MOSC domain-containing protein YiiM